jgi:hypothetical protein
LLRTTEVEEFLSNLNLSSHALVAPKGFGKTLVLKLKRISLQENDYRCFPFSPIVDRPSNKPPILPNEIINVLESSDNWETLWNIAFSICLIKRFQDDRDVVQQLTDLVKSDDLPPTLLNILTHPHITRPFDILHDCLAAQRNEIFLIMRAAQQVTRIFATIHKQAGIFVDNIDEYLIHYINFSYPAPQRGPRTICPYLARRPDRRLARLETPSRDQSACADIRLDQEGSLSACRSKRAAILQPEVVPKRAALTNRRHQTNHRKQHRDRFKERPGRQEQ